MTSRKNRFILAAALGLACSTALAEDSLRPDIGRHLQQAADLAQKG